MLFRSPRVEEWVKHVVEVSASLGYRRQDGVFLPQPDDGHSERPPPPSTARSRLGWAFTTEELLADAVWLEQDHNKSLIEDRYGRKIFTQGASAPQDFLQPRASREYPETRRKSWVDAVPGILVDPTTGDESEPTSERGRKRRLLPAFRSESPRKKHEIGRAHV